MIQNGTVTIQTKIERNDGKVEEESAEYEVINGVVQNGDVCRQRD